MPEFVDFKTAKMYSDMMNGNFYIAVDNITQIEECKAHGLKFYYKHVITSFFELQAFKEIGVSYAVIGVPLIFDLKNVAKCGVPLRAIPNLAYAPYMVKENGIHGGWIRPEDTETYSQYISVFEFYAPGSLIKESTLYHVYAENKHWPGNLNLLIENLNFDFDNSILYDADNFAIRRMGCRHQCMANKTCHYCDMQLKFTPTFEKYRASKKEKI